MNASLARYLFALSLIMPATALAQPGDRGPRHDDDAHAEQRQGNHERERPERRAAEIPVDRVDQAFETLRTLHPDAEWLPRIAELVKTDPAEAAKAIARFPRIAELIEARLNRPEEFALHVDQARLMREVFPMVRRYREAKRNNDQETLDVLRPQIRERVTQVFETRLAMKRIEIDRLRAQLQAAEQELVEVEANKDDAIEARLTDMLESDRRRRGGDDRERRRERGEGERRERE